MEHQRVFRARRLTWTEVRTLNTDMTGLQFESRISRQSDPSLYTAIATRNAYTSVLSRRLRISGAGRFLKVTGLLMTGCHRWKD